jgi:hypothetical protein
MVIYNREEYLLEIWQDNIIVQCYLKGSTACNRPFPAGFDMDRRLVVWRLYPNQSSSMDIQIHHYRRIIKVIQIIQMYSAGQRNSSHWLQCKFLMGGCEVSLGGYVIHLLVWFLI